MAKGQTMKINGVVVTKPSEEVLILPRGDQDLVFRAQALPDLDEFDKLCPEPKPPGKLTKDGFVPLLDDPGYRQIKANHDKQRMGFIVIHSLAPSNIEWDAVDPDNPATWAMWQDELKAAGLNYVEINRVAQLVLDANSLNQAKIDEAHAAFVRGKVVESAGTSSPSTEQPTT